MFKIWVLVFVGYVQSKESNLVILPRDVESCNPGEMQSWDLKNVTLLKAPDTEQTTISGDMILTEPFDEKAFVRLVIFKCWSAELSSCSNYITLNDKDVCKDVGDPNKMWQPLMTNVKAMPNSCPIAVGSYKLVNVPFTEVLGEKVDCLPGFWKIQVIVKKGSRTLGCVQGYGEIKQKRRSRKKPS